MGHRVVAADLKLLPASPEQSADDLQVNIQLLHRRVDDADGKAFAVGGPCGSHVQRRGGFDRNRCQPEVLAVEHQRKPVVSSAAAVLLVLMQPMTLTVWA